MTQIVISGSGLYTPPHAVSNEELVQAFNQYVDLYNEENASAIDAGQLDAKQHSSSDFIEGLRHQEPLPGEPGRGAGSRHHAAALGRAPR